METVSAGPDRLSIEELALEAETTTERIQRLVEIGAFAPGDDGAFNRGDVIRARVVSAFPSAMSRSTASSIR